MNVSATLNSLRRARQQGRFAWLCFRPGHGERYVTCAGKSDGAGAQAQAVISVMLFARVIGARYIHTPFQQVDHNQAGDPDWAGRWERFLNFGAGEMELDDVYFPIQLVESPYGVTKSHVLYRLPHCYDTWRFGACRLPELIDDLQKRFFADKLPIASKEEKLFEVVIHVRRGDVEQHGVNKRRFTRTLKVEEVYRRITGVLNQIGIRYRCTLFSQADPLDFGILADRGVTIDTATDPFETFLRMARADLLVTAKSSFSYLAAMLGSGIVVYEPFWHGPLAAWLQMESSGSIDDRALRRRLASVS